MKNRRLTKPTPFLNVYIVTMGLCLSVATIQPATAQASDFEFSTPKALAAGLASVGAGSLMAGLTIMLPAQLADASADSTVEDLRVFSSL